MKWILENKDWLFSGVGVVLLGLLFKYLLHYKRSTQSLSTNEQNIENIKIGNAQKVQLSNTGANQKQKIADTKIANANDVSIANSQNNE